MSATRTPRRVRLHPTPEQLEMMTPVYPGTPEAVVARAALRRVAEGRAVAYSDGTIELREATDA